jgi:hypothetical protein
VTRRIVRTLKYMEPIEYNDGHGFKTIVEMSDGKHVLISEIHRRKSSHELDETVAFECDKDGRVTDWSEMCCSGEDTAEVISRVADWYTHS